MATGPQDDKPRRAVDVAPAAIADELNDGNCAEAVHTAIAALLSELAKTRKDRPTAEWMLLHAEVAGVIQAAAASVRPARVKRPPTYQGGIPTGRDLWAAFHAALTGGLRRAAGGSGASNES
jgi:hypothetical protein